MSLRNILDADYYIKELQAAAAEPPSEKSLNKAKAAIDALHDFKKLLEPHIEIRRKYKESIGEKLESEFVWFVKC
jgi:hypothetical protein